MSFAKKENETWSISVYCLLGTAAEQVFKTEKKLGKREMTDRNLSFGECRHSRVSLLALFALLNQSQKYFGVFPNTNYAVS